MEPTILDLAIKTTEYALKIEIRRDLEWVDPGYPWFIERVIDAIANHYDEDAPLEDIITERYSESAYNERVVELRDELADAAAYAKDPYAYHGVRRSDF